MLISSFSRCTVVIIILALLKAKITIVIITEMAKCSNLNQQLDKQLGTKGGKYNNSNNAQPGISSYGKGPAGN